MHRVDFRTNLESARAHHASDVHLVRGIAPALRINGEIRPIEGPPMEVADLQSLYESLMNDKQKGLFEKEWQACFSRHMPGIGRFRISVYSRAAAPSSPSACVRQSSVRPKSWACRPSLRN